MNDASIPSQSLPFGDASGPPDAQGSRRAHGIGPLQLRAISPAAARASRTLHDTRLVALVRTRCALRGLQVVICDDPEPPVISERIILDLDCHLPDGTGATLRIVARAGRYPLLDSTARPLTKSGALPPPTGTESPFDGVSHALADAVAAALLAPISSALSGLLELPVAVRCVQWQQADAGGSDSRDGHETDCRLSLSFHHGAHLHEVDVVTPASLLEVLGGMLAGMPVLPVLPWHRQLQLPGQLVLGMRALGVGLLRSLEPGDVLLRCLFPGMEASVLQPDAAPTGAPPRAVLSWGTPPLYRLCVAVQCRARTLTLLGTPVMTDDITHLAPGTPPQTDQASQLVDIDQLELPVHFEIDTVALALAQLNSLAPGYVIELPVQLEHAHVRMVAHGQTIGTGELVSVGDHLGIRIIQMAHAHDPIQ